MDTVATAVGSPLVKVEGLRQTYPKGGASDLLVLDDVSLALRDNEIVALLGRSGCGKSTLLRIIAGLLPATSGSVTIAGQRISGPAGQVAMVFQTFALFPWLTVLENVDSRRRDWHRRSATSGRSAPSISSVSTAMKAPTRRSCRAECVSG